MRVPLETVTFLPGEQQHEGRSGIFVAVKKETGRVSKVSDFPYPVAVPQEKLSEALTQDIGFMRTLLVGQGLQTIAVAVKDEISGTEAHLQRRVLVGIDKNSEE